MPDDPITGSSLLGPLVSATSRQRVRDYIHKGVDEGARIIIGGADAARGTREGLLRRADRLLRRAQRHDDRPRGDLRSGALSIIPYDTEDEAIEIANDSTYGLAGGVWAGTDEKAFEVARKIRTGQVEINGGAFNVVAPFGGYKQSGIGRELGKYGFEEFLEVKAIQHN